MEKQFIVKQKTWIYIVASALLIILLGSILVNMLAIFRVGNMMSSYIPLDAASIVIMAIVALLIVLFIFLSRYKVSKNGIYVYIGFFRLSYKYEDIYLMRVNSSKTMLLLYVKAQHEDKADIKDDNSNLYANILQVFIPQSKVDEFVNAVKSNAKDLAFEILPDERK